MSLLTLDGRREFRVRWSEYGRQAVARGKLRGESDLVYRGGAFYLALVVESKDAPPYEPKGALGVDLGVVNIAVDSDGTFYKADGVDQVRRRIDRLRAHLQSAGTKSAKRHLKGLGRREGNFRRQTNHYISKEIVARAEGTARAVALEDLGGIRSRTTVRRSQRRRHLSWSFAQLRSFVEYKAAAKGVPVVLVDPTEHVPHLSLLRDDRQEESTDEGRVSMRVVRPRWAGRPHRRDEHRGEGRSRTAYRGGK